MTPRGDGDPVVLLVDDDAAVRRSVAEGLELEGFEVVLASGGRAALAALEAVTPAVVVLDLAMPDLDGLEVLRRLREAGHDVPVCILSARDEVDDRVRGRRNASSGSTWPAACRIWRASTTSRACGDGRAADADLVHRGAADRAASGAAQLRCFGPQHPFRASANRGRRSPRSFRTSAPSPTTSASSARSRPRRSITTRPTRS